MWTKPERKPQVREGGPLRLTKQSDALQQNERRAGYRAISTSRTARCCSAARRRIFWGVPNCRAGVVAKRRPRG